MDANGKDGFTRPRGPIPILNVKPLCTLPPYPTSYPANPYLNRNIPNPHISEHYPIPYPVPPPPPQEGFGSSVVGHSVYDPAEIRRRIHQADFLKARKESEAFAAPGIRTPDQTHASISGTRFMASQSINVSNNVHNQVSNNIPRESPSASPMNMSAPTFLAAQFRKPETIQNECPLHNSIPQSIGNAIPSVHEQNSLLNENPSTSACPLHASMHQQNQTDLKLNENLKFTEVEDLRVKQEVDNYFDNFCTEFSMGADIQSMDTPMKFNNCLSLSIMPKPEYSNEETPEALNSNNLALITPKSEVPEALNSNNLALIIPKSEAPEALNSNNLALIIPQSEYSTVPKLDYGNASSSFVCNADPGVPSAEDLRSALANSLKRYKDLTVLQPGSTFEPHCSSFVETDSDSVKRKKPKTHRPRPMFQQNLQLFTGSDREKVLRTLMTYDALRRLLEEQTRRPDLKAGTVLLDRGLTANRDRRIVGPVPGVNVGDHFYFRMELCVIGLHCPTQAGIDYIGAKNSEWNEPIAISIIASGGYEDDEDGGEELIYTGHGGNNYVSDHKKQSVDQKLERGNFALERSKHYGVDVRVIRGIKDAVSPCGKVYIYDGLYKVQDSWLDKGRSGSGVFKYRLLRTPGQPELGSTILKNARRWKSQPVLRDGLIHPDISFRNEQLPVCLVNDVDTERGPPHFEYITRVRYPDYLLNNGIVCHGCECIGGCNAGGNCSCVWRNGGQMPYNANCVLIKGKPLIYECGSRCKCPYSCCNRVTQKGLNTQLEVFRTRGLSSNANGWGVRSWEPIAAGRFICEYTGEIVPNEAVHTDRRCNMGDEYILDPSKQGPGCGDVSYLLSEDQQQKAQDASSSQACVVAAPSNLNFCIDASKMGNVARFMNHASFPNANVFMQFVLHDHDDIRFPHVMLFAMYNIPPLTELLLDYKQEKATVQPKEEVDIGSTSRPECSQRVVGIEHTCN